LTKERRKERYFNTLPNLIAEDKRETKRDDKKHKEVREAEAKEIDHQEKTGEVGAITKGA